VKIYPQIGIMQHRPRTDFIHDYTTRFQILFWTCLFSRVNSRSGRVFQNGIFPDSIGAADIFLQTGCRSGRPSDVLDQLPIIHGDKIGRFCRSAACAAVESGTLLCIALFVDWYISWVCANINSTDGSQADKVFFLHCVHFRLQISTARWRTADPQRLRPLFMKLNAHLSWSEIG